jgi:His-Xaa-Ser system protein HxsD
MPSDQASVVLHVDETIYNRTTVLRATYWFTDRCYVFVTRSDPGILDVHIRPKDTNADIAAISGEFQNSLLEYELRRLIQDESGKIRELLVAKAVNAALDEPPPGSLIPGGDTA